MKAARPIVFFDIDHTLLDPCYGARQQLLCFWQDVLLDCFAEMCEPLRGFNTALLASEISTKHAYSLRSRNPYDVAATMASLINDKFRQYQQENPDIEYEKLAIIRQKVIHHIAGAQFQNGADLGAAMDMYECEKTDYFPEVEEMLQWLEANEVIIGIITARPRQVVEHRTSIIADAETFLWNYVHPALIFSSDDGRKKEPEGRESLIVAIVDALDSSSIQVPLTEQMVMVGDHIDDVKLALDMQCHMLVAAYSNMPDTTEMKRQEYGDLRQRLISGGRVCNELMSISDVQEQIKKILSL